MFAMVVASMEACAGTGPAGNGRARRCWRRRAQRPGRPRIDASYRDLIRRLATENCLWGAPRIHGEWLKLGITTWNAPSRGICTAARRPGHKPGVPSSRTTSVARHLSPVMFADAHDEDIAVDASDLSARPAALIDASCAFIHRTSVDWERSLQPSSLGMRFGTNHCQDDTGVHQSSGRDPHGTDGCHQPRGVPLTAFLRLTPV